MYCGLQPHLRTAILATARVRSTPGFCQAFATGLAIPSVVLARIWLADDAGDLRLAGSAGAPTGGGIYNRLDGEFACIARGAGRGAGKIAQIADSRAPFIVRGIRGDEDWIANPGWVARQGVRAFLGYPLIAGDEAVGVMAVFDRTMPPDGTLEELQFIADYAAARIMDLRDREAIHTQVLAFEEGRTGDTRAFAPEPDASFGAGSPGIVTRAELRELEKRTIEAALARTNGKVFGPRGAAALLEMKPTTLASRIKALGLR